MAKEKLKHTHLLPQRDTMVLGSEKETLSKFMSGQLA